MEIKYSEEIEKVLNEKKTDCRLYGTEQCAALNAPSCQECEVGRLKPESQEKAKAALGRLVSAAPQELLEPLYNTHECRFCKGEKGEASCYALLDLSRRDEEGDWVFAIGRRKVGVKASDMVLPLQVACCKKCRDAHRRFDYLPGLLGIMIAAAGLIVTAGIPPVYKALFGVAPWLPAAVMGGFGLLAVAVTVLLKKSLAEKMSKHMHIDAEQVPEIAKLVERGFTEVQEKKCGVSALVFSNKFREHGVGSRITGCGGEEPRLMGIWPAEQPRPETEEKTEE